MAPRVAVRQPPHTSFPVPLVQPLHFLKLRGLRIVVTLGFVSRFIRRRTFVLMGLGDCA